MADTEDPADDALPLSALGGVSMRSFTPVWSNWLWRGLEQGLEPWMDHLAMFALICLERRSG
jgi:hypothetical protein